MEANFCAGCGKALSATNRHSLLPFCLGCEKEFSMARQCPCTVPDGRVTCPECSTEYLDALYLVSCQRCTKRGCAGCFTYHGGSHDGYYCDDPLCVEAGRVADKEAGR